MTADAASTDAGAVDEAVVDPATGSKRGDDGKAARGRKGKHKKHGTDGPFEITLVHARNTHLGWTVISLVIGVLLVWKLAIVGQVLGVLFLVFAAFAGRRFVMTLINPPGTIKIENDKVELPLGLCRGRVNELTYDQIQHVFFLRRAVPWTRAGPVLVVETGELAFTYPRDWFASESEQRRVLQGIHRRLERPE
ncbi:MAG TPA: hypothetical protein VML75_15090 [Kofleriaceae bacterium]|nr:hypothetical protein [Kofleriaceae bacterium]